VRAEVVVVIAVSIGVFLSLPLLRFAIRYLGVPAIDRRKWPLVGLLILMPLGLFFLIPILDGPRILLPVVMGSLLIAWMFLVVRAWRTAARSGLHMRLARTRHQKFQLFLALLTTVLQSLMVFDPDTRLLAITALIWVVMALMQGMVPNYMTGAGVFMNGSLFPWGTIEGVSWRDTPEPLVMHTKGRLGGRLQVPVRPAQRGAVETLLRQSLPWGADYSPIAGS
jgi:hypothetical protein